MVRHMVLFKFKTTVTEGQIELLENGLGSLPGIIPEIREYEFGRNIALVSTFDDLDSLRKYSSHPEHQKVLKHINAICDSIKSVDYEMSESAEPGEGRSRSTRADLNQKLTN
ncbi:MAG TPA: Dabb family protein [Candidatus Kryptobacter bacterium]|nr:Dabb family protein [Candidatus Kryptobacter bacterium]